MRNEVSPHEHNISGTVYIDRAVNPDKELPHDLKVAQARDAERIRALKIGFKTGSFALYDEIWTQQNVVMPTGEDI